MPSAGGHRPVAAEVGGADRPQPASAAADSAGGASGGSRGAGERRPAQLHHGPAAQREPEPAGPAQL